MIIISYGAGTNSLGILCGMKERGLKPDAIVFCNTKAERPDIYDNIKIVSNWCISNGFPDITIISNEKESRYGGLENMCLARRCLPSLAYGFKTCSLAYKKEPFDDWIKKNGITDYERWIGIDTSEEHRAKKFEGTRYPLIEWGWNREACIEAIERNGLPQPGKSSCFFCPSTKKSEIMKLREDYPDLAARAVAMERNADLTSIKGLGRNFAWSDLYEAKDRQQDMFCESRIEIDCGCYDG